jgi:hypothetical protein
MMRIKAISDDYITVEVRETLVEQDYAMVVPELARLSERNRGELNVLFELRNFHGWDPPELSTKTRADTQPLGTAGKVAVVSDDERSGRRLARPLFAGELRTFQPHARRQAERWLAGHA